ncbi:MAG: inorganic pyrophosphatase [Chitinophagales bacterium]|nr:inorganic pyrophosphatase [Chitinophagales bacterium]
MKNKFIAHPWHGIDLLETTPNEVYAFIEIVPTDTVKYEIDKASGFLKIDRPQKFSNIIPCLYGFIPQTYCEKSVATFAQQHEPNIQITDGDKDPLDICVLTSRNIHNGNILVRAKPIGGLRLIDKGEADDKIIAVLEGDDVFQSYNDIDDIPTDVINRLKHYFLTYKNLPNENKVCDITAVYNKTIAHQVIAESIKDYKNNFNI